MFITEYQTSEGGRIELGLDGKIKLRLYVSEARQLSLKEGMELSDEQYRYILHEILGRRAVKRAMHLLERQERTERQLRDKLIGDYPPEAVEEAVAYVKRYRYLDDRRYAETFIRYHQEDRSRMRIGQDLLRRGVPKKIIEECMEQEFVADERAQIRRLLEKKRFSPDTADPREAHKMYQFLMRRGFRSEDIASVMRADDTDSA